MHLVDAVRRQRLTFAVLVLAAGLLQLAVVRADAGGGELVDPDPPEVGSDVVPDDLPVPLDRGISQAQRRRPVLDVDADCGGFALELLVPRPLLECIQKNSATPQCIANTSVSEGLEILRSGPVAQGTVLA